MRALKLFFLLLCFVLKVHFSVATFPNETDSLSSFLASMQLLSELQQESLNSIALKVEIASRSLNQSNSRCYEEITKILQKGMQRESSAKLITANSFFSESFLPNLISQQFSSLGDFDSCLSLSRIPSSVNSWLYNGKYCLLHLQTPSIEYGSQRKAPSPKYIDQLSLNWASIGRRLDLVNGICIPSFCSARELTLLLENYFSEYLNGIQLQVRNCQTARQLTIEKPDFAYNLAKIILSILFLTTAISTFLSSFLPNQNSPSSQLLTCFHLGANFRSIFQLPNQNSATDVTKIDLSFINGFRVWLNCLTILAHTFFAMPASLFASVSPFRAYPSFYIQKTAPSNRIHLESLNIRGGFIMDHFILLTGFLLTYTVLGRGKKPSGFLAYAGGRWIRLLPSIVVILCLNIWAQKAGSGPLFTKQLTDVHVAPCKAHWASHLFFLNNLLDMNQMCGPHLWFVAADFQLHLLLYPILLLLFAKPKLAVGLICLLITSSMVGLFGSAWLGLAQTPDFGFSYKFDSPILFWSIKIFYTSPFIRLVPYLLGSFLAIYLLKSKKKLSKKPFGDALFWITFALLHLIILYPTPAFIASNPTLSTLYYLLLQLLHTFLALFYFYTFLTALESPFKAFFSSPLFLPLSRLSYGTYLVHIPLIWFNLAQIRTAQPLTGWFHLQFFTLIYVQSLCLSTVLYVFCEAPFTNLSKVGIKLMMAKKRGGKALN